MISDFAFFASASRERTNRAVRSTGGVDDLRSNKNPEKNAAAQPSTAMVHAKYAGGRGERIPAGVLPAHSKSNLISLADCHRPSGSLARQCSTIWPKLPPSSGADCRLPV